MTAFQEWLGRVGLGHCAQRLLENGIDFDVAPGLTESDLRSLGLNLGDSRRLLQALRMLTQREAAASAESVTVVGGASRPGRAATDEHRQLTVMFCDLVNFTNLAQRIDPEELKGVVRSFRRVCADVVARYDGHVAQYMGDGLMVYFGWPAAHEDDPERCVRAALDIVQAVKGEPVAERLSVHVGIATGRVIVGDSAHDGNRDDGLAIGETPNLAARLQGLAGADEIVIGASTRRLIGNTFELTDLGTHTLKGIVQPVQAWRVQAVLRGEGRFDAAHSGLALTALVGRDEEVAILQSRWAWARGGQGQVVLLSGEPGIGKSRLTQVLREEIQAEPHIAVRYQCSPFRLNSPLYPIIEQIEFAAGFTRDDTPEQKLDKLEAVQAGDQEQRTESAPFLAALLSLPTERYPPVGLSPRKRKERTLEVLAGQVEALSRVQPLLMILEDAHWIDPTTQELLDVWVPRLRVLRVLLILTHRPQYTPHGREHPHVSALVLTGLPERLGAELVCQVTQGKALPSQLLHQIVARTDGIPLFIEELTKSVLESQLLREEHDRYTLVEALPPMVPTTLSASLVERLGRRAGVRELAQIGACLGREFPYELLAAVSPYQGREFEEELQQLTATGLVFRRGTPPDAVYTFKHALVQDAAYDSLLKAKRQQLHARIAEALAASFPERVDAEPELLAHHHSQAGHLTEAIPFWRKAGEAAQARVALQEAVAYLQNGLTAVEKLPPSPERDDLELSLRERLHSARLQWHGWAAPDVGVNAESILRLAEKRDKPSSLLIGLWGKWVSTLTQGRVEEAPVWARRLLAEGTQRHEIDLQILGHRGSMFSHFYLGELEAAWMEGSRALELYDPSRAVRWIGLVGNDVRTAVGVCLSQALWMRGEVDRAAHVSDQKDADARGLGHPFDIGWALTWGAYVFDYRREPDRLLAHADEADRLARDHGIPLLSNALVPVGRGLARLRMGQPADAAALLKQGIAAWTAGGGHLNVPYMKSALAEAQAQQGDLDEGLRLVDEALAQIERPGWHERVWLAEVLRLKGWILMRRGRLAEAEDALQASIAQAREQQAKSWELRSATTLAQLHVASGQPDAARSLLGPIYRSFTEGFATYDLRAAQALLDELG
jgi:class 3 adenylate cyclase/tetratricopeptide (TPR) repeat protein